MRTPARALALLLLAASAAQAQSPPATKQPPKPQPKQKTERPAFDPVAEARRATAISLVGSLADEARAFRDGQLRARVQARAAEALWETDAERSRGLFRRAWEAADAADGEALRRSEEERQRQLAQGGSSVTVRPPDLRGEVLRLAARRDRELGEEFLSKLDEARRHESGPAGAEQPRTDAGPAELASQSQRQRLALARQLLEAGDRERALQFAGPALQTVSQDSIHFLSQLRESGAEQADKIYAALLARAAADPAADANTVSLLSSYVFTPLLFITVERGGGYSINSSGRSQPPAEFPAALRAAFLQTAAQVLLRPPAPADQDRTTGGRHATYFVIARLLPFYEQFLPEPVPHLRTQLSALTPDVSQQFRSSIGQLATTGLEGRRDEPPADEVQGALDRVANAKTPDERDRAYVSAAMAASDRGDPRAREFAERVSDRDARAQLVSYVDYSAASRAVNRKDVEELLRLARGTGLTPLQRVWALTEAARLSVKEDRSGALQHLDEAFAAARRMNGDDTDRARAMLSALTPLYELDPARVWSHMPELVKTVNALPDFTGDDGRLVVKFQTKGRSSIQSSTVEGFNLQPLFRALARADLDRAVELARSFTGESPRAVATLAVATAVLGEPEKPRPKS